MPRYGWAGPLFALALLGACGGDTPTSPAAAGGPVTAQFTVMTFNIQHGLNLAGHYGLAWSIDAVARVAPDIVGMQELTRNHPFYECEDQPARLAAGLTAATGRQWHSVYQQEWFTQIRDCVDTGRGDGVATEGLGFLASRPIAPPVHTALHNGRIGLLTMVTAGGRQVPVVTTHLAHGSGAGPAAERLRQLEPLLAWTVAQAGGGPIVLMGDFNHRPDAEEYSRIRAAGFRDAWEDSLSAGSARGRLDGITKGSSRIDYIFYIPAGVLDVLWVDNVDTRALTGTAASDHNPLVAAFGVR